ncbi:hypothetical protein PI126_g15839 [Phytophthora idaei]|nr:hypothetical protein PI126_g15839 [Phytophthora idaei]
MCAPSTASEYVELAHPVCLRLATIIGIQEYFDPSGPLSKEKRQAPRVSLGSDDVGDDNLWREVTARIIKLNTMWYLLASAGVETASPVLLRVVFVKINMLLFASALFFLLLQSRGICSPAL